MNIGIIGAGKHSEQSHLAFLANSKNCRVAAIADLDQSRMHEVKSKLKLDARLTTNWEDIIDDDTVEAVYVMTPDRFHTQQLAAAVAIGKHVFCEKPLADNYNDYGKVDTALTEAEAKGLVVASCHPRRFDPPFMQARKLLRYRNLIGDRFGAGQIDLGDVTGFDFSFRYHKPSKEGLHESLMFDHLNHEVDLANFLFGISGLKKAIKLKDSATEYAVSGVRDDGVEFNFRGSRHLNTRTYQEDMRINFERGALAMDMHHGVAMLDYEDAEPRRQRLEQYKTNYDKRFQDINEHFLRAASEREAPYLTANELRMNTLAAIVLHNSDEAVAVKV